MVNAPDKLQQVEPGLLAAWLTARSVIRGLPHPVSDGDGFCVDSGLPGEQRRYVFASPVPAIHNLAASITAPHIFIKLCGSGAQLLELVPPRWQLQPAAYLMRQDGNNMTAPLPDGYRMEVTSEQAATVARIFATDDMVAASGYAIEHGGVFIFDRIATEAAHRRRGLGKAVMAALGRTQKSRRSQRVLVATEDGRALYATMGWTVLSPYSTVVIA